MAQQASSLNLNSTGGVPTNFMQQIPVHLTASGSQLPMPQKPEVSQIMQSDPSLIGGYRCVFDRKCPFTLWVTDEALVEKVGHHIMQAEELRVKILIKGHEERPEVVRVELFSLTDYFFIYGHSCDSMDYIHMAEEQQLIPLFADYLTMLVRLFNSALQNPDTYRLQIQLNLDNSSDLFFNQILPYKDLQMLGCHFNLLSEETIYKHIKFRHQMAMLQHEDMQKKLATITKTIKEKNPALLHHICKEVQNMRPYGDQLDVRAVKQAGKSNGPRSAVSRTSGRSNRTRKSVTSIGTRQ